MKRLLFPTSLLAAFNRQPMKWLLVLIALLACAAPSALAQSAPRTVPNSQSQPEQAQPAWTDPEPDPIRRNFDPQATLDPAGRSVVVTGRIGVCEPGERTAEIQVSLLQPTTQAALNAKTTLPCPTGQTVRFVIQANVPDDKPAFDEGPVQACALAISRSGRSILWLNILDVEQWCTFIRLVKE
jgi:hypothetical protein